MVQSLIESITGYPGLWFVCAGSGVVVPVPEDVPLMYAGSRIAEGAWSWPVTLGVAWVGVAVRDLRDLGSWMFGRYVGAWLLDSERLGWLFSGRRIQRARRLIGEHGIAAVLLGRFMVGFRAPMFAAAGAMGVPLRSFALVDAAGLLVAIPLAVVLGFWFGDPIRELATAILQRTTAVVGLTVLVATAWFAWKALTTDAVKVRLARRAAGPPEDPPEA
jgi:membrane protein DedA with SNARE-associated domain